MASRTRDESVSPMTTTPRPASPANVDARSNVVMPDSTADTLLPPVNVKTIPSSAPAIPETTEARDYWNAGLSHPPTSPTTLGKSKTPPPALDLSVPGRRASDGDVNLDGQPSPGRRSVQFADLEERELEAPDGLHDDPDTPGKSRAGSFMSKIKGALGGSQTPKTPGTPAAPPELGTQPSTEFSTAGRQGQRAVETLTEEDTDADADAEETADEAARPEAAKSKKKKRRIRRPRRTNTSNLATPKRLTHDTENLSSYNRFLRRRASMPDPVPLSEGEGRDQLRERSWRRGSTWMNPAMRPPGEETADEAEETAVVGRRTGHLRRVTVLGGGGVSDGDAMTPRRPFFNSERASTFGAQKWKQVKNTLRLLRQKKEDRFDYYKSAELMAELRAGAPAVLMLASMIQRDEHGNKRIPVLLEQLKLKVKDSAPMPDDDKDRHWMFTIELEYGSGPSRMVWDVMRTVRDIYNLHLRYKFALNNDKYVISRSDAGGRPKQPKFPYSAFPYLRGARKKGDDSEEDEQPEQEASVRGEDTAGEMTAGEEVMFTDADGAHVRRKRSRINLLGMRRRSTGFTDPGELSNAEGAVMDAMTRRQRYVDKQRRVLEKYLSEMIRWLMFRADSNRLCRFLELSALGVRLAAEGSYHGKEGFLHIQSSKGLDFRRVLSPAKFLARHNRKWFLVRQSYIVCVDSPENMNIYDVYLVDSGFSIKSKRNPLKQIGTKEKKEIDLTVEAPPEKHHTLTLHTSERKVRLFSGNQSVMKQFEDSINEMLKQTAWYQKKRFDSFAPVRTGVFAQWLVDGRDYMWNVSRAINMAKDVIYIHDWWLSPELYMRRPAAISQKWRLDRLLQKKAREGVKIFVIIYRNVEAAVPIDSEYTKFSLLNLHPNIFVQRSPNQFKKNQFFFAHHEKICIVDHDVAFVGGIDLCFGRWDCPQHPIVDDKPTGFEHSETPKDAEHCQLFPGKDYSNPRVQDFFRLNEPYEEMYDRSNVPRMPWHDVSMQVVGQPARDLTRHFVQRWNYLRRGRKPTRPLPFLLPAPDAKMEELEALGLTGTCEVQILRSAANWSLGIEETEHSIQNAYIKMIEDSDHFVYMENQFFVTSTDVYGTRIVNRIGDALVERIIRAHKNDEDWRCVILIPLMPGFQNTVDEQEGTSVRLILMCQFRSICRGDDSIFGRLRKEGIEPEDYINFFSLRQWGVMANEALVTEQLYIHAKAIVVDDRVALIGSANINERSMLGSRDSECAAIVRDTDMIWSTMAGKPYQVGRFAHTLRLRLMREHLGLDVDEILEQEREAEMDREEFEQEMDNIYEADQAPPAAEAGPSRRPDTTRLPSFNHDLDLERAQATHEASDTSSVKGKEADARVIGNKLHELDVSGYGPDHWKSAEKMGQSEGRDSVIVNGREVLVHSINNMGKGTLDEPKAGQKLQPTVENSRYLEPHNQDHAGLPPMPALNRRTTDQLGLPRASQLPTIPMTNDTDIGGPALHIDPTTGNPVSGAFHPMAADIKQAHIDKDCMRDPVDANFIDEVWNRVAQNNTKLYRRVFRCMPDSEVGTWAEYRDYTEYFERFRASMEGRSRKDEPEDKLDVNGHASTAAGAGVSAPGPDAIAKAVGKGVEKIPEKVADRVRGDHEEHPQIIIPQEDGSELKEEQGLQGAHNESTDASKPRLNTQIVTDSQHNGEAPSPVYSAGDTPFPPLETTGTKFLEPQASTRTRDRRTTFSSLEKPSSRDTNHTANPATGQIGSIKKRRRATTKNSRRGTTIEDMPSRADAEELLNLVQGHLVQFPYDWLAVEEHNGNWGYQVDGVAPIAIYN